jgi:hypothetical protein
MTERGSGGWRTIAGVVVIVALAGGWFALSSTAFHTATTDALGEAAGVAFALLVVVSIIGAIRNARRGGDAPEEAEPSEVSPPPPHR